jgi:UDP-N-acetylglucosamine enolpyruvyl transferase
MHPMPRITVDPHGGCGARLRETSFHATTLEELGRDIKISNASNVVKLVGFHPNVLSSWMKDIAIITRTGE